MREGHKEPAYREIEREAVNARIAQVCETLPEGYCLVLKSNKRPWFAKVPAIKTAERSQ